MFYSLFYSMFLNVWTLKEVSLNISTFNLLNFIERIFNLIATWLKSVAASKECFSDRLSIAGYLWWIGKTSVVSKEFKKRSRAAWKMLNNS